MVLHGTLIFLPATFKQEFDARALQRAWVPAWAPLLMWVWEQALINSGGRDGAAALLSLWLPASS